MTREEYQNLARKVIAQGGDIRPIECLIDPVAYAQLVDRDNKVVATATYHQSGLVTYRRNDRE